MAQETGSIKLTNTLFGQKNFTSTEVNVDADASELDSIIDGSGGIVVSEVNDKLDINGSELADVLEYDSTQDGIEDKIYVDSANGLMYIWNGTAYVLLSASGSVYYDFEDSQSDGNVVITARSETP